MPRVRRLLIASILAAALWPSTAVARSTFCSPTGDFCQAAKKEAGVVRLSLTTFSFRGSIQVCVAYQTDDEYTCHSFRLHAIGSGLYESKVRWAAFFPHEKHGRYRVTWEQDGYRIGQRVSFSH